MDVIARRVTRPIALACSLVVAACGGAPTLDPSRSPSPMGSVLASPGQTVEVGTAPTRPPATAPSGLTRLTGVAVGGNPSPRFSVLAPDGWTGGSFILSLTDPLVAGMSLWIVRQVPSDPCQWKGTFVTPGPTVDEHVELLLAQRLRDASAPVDVTLAGYAGKYLEWSVPDDMVVTGYADFQGCDATEEGHTDFVSWSAGEHSRFHQVAGQVDRLWILDVAGQTMIVDAAYGPNTPATVRDQLAAIVETLEIEAP